jgi:hypothetical protein
VVVVAVRSSRQMLEGQMRQVVPSQIVPLASGDTAEGAGPVHT